jgi:hypothetical protein
VLEHSSHSDASGSRQSGPRLTRSNLAIRRRRSEALRPRPRLFQRKPAPCGSQPLGRRTGAHRPFLHLLLRAGRVYHGID